MRVKIDVIGLASNFLQSHLHLAFDGGIGGIAGAAFVSQMLSPVKLARESAFAFLASVPSLSVVAKVFLFTVFGQSSAIDEDFVTR